MPVFARRSRLTVIAVAAALVAAGSPLAALKAAGLNGKMPVGGQAIEGSDQHAAVQLGVADRDRRRPGAGAAGRADDLRLDPRDRPSVSGDRRDHADPRRDPGRPGLGARADRSSSMPRPPASRRSCARRAGRRRAAERGARRGCTRRSSRRRPRHRRGFSAACSAASGTRVLGAFSWTIGLAVEVHPDHDRGAGEAC